jgi:hypothetical protein
METLSPIEKHQEVSPLRPLSRLVFAPMAYCLPSNSASHDLFMLLLHERDLRLHTSAVMSEFEEPVTLGRVIVDRGKDGKDGPVNALHSFAKGAALGPVVAGQILCNVR